MDDAVAAAVAADPRLKVGEGGLFAVATAKAAPAGGAVAAAALSARISVAVELTPRNPVPDRMVTMLEVEVEVEVASKTAGAIATSLFSMS